MLRTHYFWGVSLRASDADGDQRIVGFRFAEGSRSVADDDLPPAAVDDVAIVAVGKSGEERGIVEVAHCEEAFPAAAKTEAAGLHLPVALSLTGHDVGKLLNSELDLFFCCPDRSLFNWVPGSISYMKMIS